MVVVEDKLLRAEGPTADDAGLEKLSAKFFPEEDTLAVKLSESGKLLGYELPPPPLPPEGFSRIS